MPDSPRVVALISSFNEGDIISPVIAHLVENGIEVYLLDNHSTDDTVEQASRWLGRGLLDIEAFPPDVGRGGDGLNAFDWTAILRRKEVIATELGADWYMHHDADEIRESPWPGMTLRESIRWVDTLGYNCIDYRVFNFPPVDDGFRQGDDPRTYFRLYGEGAEFDRLQLKTWKVTGSAVSLLPSGGHQASFEGRRVFPIPFLLRHYPIRGHTHGLKKVFAERRARFVQREREQGWHVQYDGYQEEAPAFLRDADELRPFDLDRVRLDCLLPDSALNNLSDRLLRTDGELQWRIRQNEDLEKSLREYQEHAAELEAERDELKRHALALESDRADLRQHGANLEAELSDLRLHVANIEDQAGHLRQHVANLEQARSERAQQIANVKNDGDESEQSVGGILRRAVRRISER